jgi:hypothetical protein
LVDSQTRLKLMMLAIIVAVACVVTPVFNALTSRSGLTAAPQGFFDALVISIAMGGYLLFVRDGSCAHDFAA